MMENMNLYDRHVTDSVMTKAKQACRSLRNVKVETVVGTGDPRDVICEAVEKMSPTHTTLVMGSHGYGPIKRALIGSVSSHCVQNAKCPVFIVKKPDIEIGRT